MAPRFTPPVPEAYKDYSDSRLRKLCVAHDLEPTGSREALQLKLAWAQLPEHHVRDRARADRDEVERKLAGRRVSCVDPCDLVDAMTSLTLAPGTPKAKAKTPAKTPDGMRSPAKTPQDEGMPSPAPSIAPAWLEEGMRSPAKTPKARVLKPALSDAMVAVQASIQQSIQAAEPAGNAPALGAEEEQGVPSRVLRPKNQKADRDPTKPKRQFKGGTVADIRKECERLNLLQTGTRVTLVSRIAWAQLSDMELRLLAREHPSLHLGACVEDRSKMIETCVQLQRSGQLPPPQQFGENTHPALAETNAACRGAMARATDLHDQRRLYFVARAPSDRSSCQHCHKAIADKEWRVGSQVCGGFTKWFHSACFAHAYGRAGVCYDQEQKIVELLRELLTTEGRWNIFESQLPTMPSKASRNFVKSLSKGLKPRVTKKQVKALWDDDDE